ncbi:MULTISPECIES: helix-turn-helix domain-containing protein [Paenibacillus]|uniref:helix-turn-helix domain-containing protein n=1 Tax=Paenibacillus TaxID=44249 RepID=UPI0011A29D8D|nr:helix-turn-helix transcriptional regulator [Paenibacillus sp. IHBB 10380]
MTFGEYIQQLRKAKGLTLVELAMKCDCSHPYLSRLEAGKYKNISSDMIRALSSALGVTHIGMMIKAGYLTEDEVLTYRKERGIHD